MAKGPSKIMKTRMFIILVLITFVGFSFPIGNLVKIQMFESSFYRTQAADQQLLDIPVNAKRGTIFDRNLKALAQSASVWTVFISPKDVAEKDKQTLVTGLSEILSMSAEDVLKSVNKDSYYEIVKRKVEKPQADQIRDFALKTGINAIYLAEDSKRYYPYGTFASTILGFTGIDNQGLDGIEAYYDNYLKGVPGRIVSAKNALGAYMPVRYEKQYEPKEGQGLVLTIDEVIQHFVEKHLEIAYVENKVKEKVTGIVMDVKTGEILGMSSKPDYDPNQPFVIYNEDAKERLAAVPAEQLREQTVVEQQKQWRNKAISDIYEPGSVFKVMTSAMAMDENKVEDNFTYVCTGHTMVEGHRMRCHKATGHGVQTFLDGFKNSCNPLFIEIGRRIGTESFFKYFKGFGFTKKTGIDLPGEELGVFYTDKQMGPVELASCSFGQSNKITPIQMITAISATVNGGNLMKPYVVKQVLDENNNVLKTNYPVKVRQIISEETSKKIAYFMEETVKSGGGVNAHIMGYRIGGKSGTAEKLDGDENARIASFVAVAPMDDPQIAVLVLIDEPRGGSSYGGTIAAPVAAGIMSDILPYIGVEPQYTAEELAKLDVKVQSVVGKTPHLAQTSLNQKGLKVRVVGNGDNVLKQVPEAGQSISRNGVVVLYTEEKSVEELVTVPTLIGLSVEQANQAATNAGLNVKLAGTTVGGQQVVQKQSHEPGQKIARGTIITITFINKNAID